MERKTYIDRDAIRELVHRFYGKVADDPELGPVFARRIHGEWAPHLATMVKFWSAVLLREMHYEGRPPEVHRAIAEIAPAHFRRWLFLFEQTLGEVFEPAPAQAILERARGIARGLSGAVFGAPWDSWPDRAER